MPEAAQVTIAFIGGTAGFVALIWAFHQVEKRILRKKPKNPKA